MHNEFLLILHATIITLATIAAVRTSVATIIALMSVECVLMNLLVTKQIMLFGLGATATDAYAIGIVLGLNLLQEYTQRSYAQRAIIISFAAGIFAMIMGQLHLWYTPAPFDTHHAPALQLLGVMPRIMIASLASYIVVLYLDYFLFGMLKWFFNGRYLPLRAGISLLASQLLDTVLFSFLALYGIVNSVSSIIIVSYSVKVCAIGISIFLVALLKPLLKHHETTI